MTRDFDERLDAWMRDLPMTRVAILELVKAEAIARGYRFEEVRDGSQTVLRMYRPDGSLAMTAVQPEDLNVELAIEHFD